MFATYSVQNLSFIKISYLNLKFTYLAGVNIVVWIWPKLERFYTVQKFKGIDISRIERTFYSG